MRILTSLAAAAVVSALLGAPAFAYSCNGGGPLAFTAGKVAGAKGAKRAYAYKGTVYFKAGSKYVFFGSNGRMMHTGSKKYISPNAVASANVRVLDDTHACNVASAAAAVRGS